MGIILRNNNVEYKAVVASPTGYARDAYNRLAKELAKKTESLQKSVEAAEFDLLWDTPAAKARAKYIEDAVEKYKSLFPDNAFNKTVIDNVRNEAFKQYEMKVRSEDELSYKALKAYDARIADLLGEYLAEQEKINKSFETEIYKVVFRCNEIPPEIFHSEDFWLNQDVNSLKQGLMFFRRAVGIR